MTDEQKIGNITVSDSMQKDIRGFAKSRLPNGGPTPGESLILDELRFIRKLLEAYVGYKE